MRQLQPEIKLALQNIDFIDRFKHLSIKYEFNLNECFENYSKEDVLAIFKELGYKASYNKKENFFKLLMNPLLICFNLTFL